MKSTRLSGQNSSDLTKKRPPSGALPYIAREGFSGTPSRPRPLSRGKPYTRRRGKAVFCRRAAPGPPPRAHPCRAAVRAPGRPAAPARPRRAARKGPTFGPGGAARENARPPENGPRWPGNATVSAAGSTAPCAPPRAPGKPAPPEAQMPPARAARRAPGVCRAAPAPPGRPPPAHTHPAGPAKAVRLALPAGCTPRGVSIPGRDRLETAAPSHAKKATIKQGINPARKGW